MIAAFISATPLAAVVVAPFVALYVYLPTAEEV